MKKLFVLIAVILLTGCATIQKMGYEQKPEVTLNKLQKEFDALPAPASRKITVAVYSFKDLTGQRKASPNIASFSTAVSQGAEAFLIKALQDVGHGEWFEVVERVNVDNLVKERTIIKQMRDAYEGDKAKPLMPLQFAGIIIEGGIVGYDSSTESGGIAYKWLGIGPQTQYSKDVVTISLRAVSVNTGKVLTTVTVNKIVYSTADSIAVMKFFKGGTQAFEFESGLTINEPTSMAVKATTEAAVVELIKEGQRKGIWDFKKDVDTPTAEPVALPVVQTNIATETKSVIIGEKSIPVEQKPEVIDDSKSVVAVDPPKVNNKKKAIKAKPAVEILRVEKPKEQVNVQLH